MPTCRAGRMGRVARCTYRPIHSKLRPSQFRDEPGGDGLYVLAAAIPNLVRAGSVPCYAALPHPSREWQYARTRPAHRSNANSVLYALVMETLNWNRWWYPRTRTRWAAAAPDASGRRSWAHTHSDISRSCAQMRRAPPAKRCVRPRYPVTWECIRYVQAVVSTICPSAVQGSRPDAFQSRWIGRPPGQPHDEIRTRGAGLATEYK